MDTSTRTTTSAPAAARAATVASSDPTAPGHRSAASKLTSCPQCAGDVVATPMTRTADDGTRAVYGWACPLHGGPLPLH